MRKKTMKGDGNHSYRKGKMYFKYSFYYIDIIKVRR